VSEILTCRVVGVPVTQGSKTAFVVKAKNRPARAVVVDVKAAPMRSWREAVRATVAERLGAGWQPEPGPVKVTLLFALPKPSSAPKRRRTWPIGARSGDADKLARAVLDALTEAAVWRDDSQVVNLNVVKDWPEHTAQMSPGCVISVQRVEHGPLVLAPETPEQERLLIP
jgi:Holliday junction resolvase RusA-like endonuclease